MSKEEKEAKALIEQVPVAKFGELISYDRRESEHYRALHTMFRDYLTMSAPPRPLSIAVFGPPGAGKSFGVTQVARSLKGQLGCKEVQPLTFNLSQYSKPEELIGAFHLVRDEGLSRKVPLVFFDEFDAALNSSKLGWLRGFLAPMQDGRFLDRGAPHPIGPAIFVIAGGTCGAFREFAQHPGMTGDEFRSAKGPDFLSRLRMTLDVPSLNFSVAYHPIQETAGDAAEAPLVLTDTFDPFGPIDAIPCEAAILVRRASILAGNLKSKAPQIERADKSFAIEPAVLRALLRLPRFEHGTLRKRGWVAGPSTDDKSKNDSLMRHNCLFPWEHLTEEQKNWDRRTVRAIPDFLAKAQYEIVEPMDGGASIQG